MRITPNWEDAHYCCVDCGKVIKIEEFESDGVKIWRCPSCNGSLYVYASTDDWNYALTRKYADEIEEGDLIPLRMSTQKGHEVLGVIEAGGKIKLGLKGYGTATVSKNDWVDVVMGTWDSNTEPWNKK